jgi:hypothetical protein
LSTQLTLGPNDEPQHSGAIVAVHYGDYRSQECWIRSGSNIGNWFCLGGEFGRPRVWVDPRSYAEKLQANLRDPGPRPGPGEVPQYPCWSDVLARGPVTLLSAGEQDTYAAGWANGRRRMAEQVEELSYDQPEEVDPC